MIPSRTGLYGRPQYLPFLRGLDGLTEFHGEACPAELKKLLQRAVGEINEAARASGPLSEDAAGRIEKEHHQIDAG